MSAPPGGERRRVRRQRVLKGALLVFGSFGRIFDCQVRNLSDEGAKLTLASTLGVPEEFQLLLLTEHRIAPARAIWRTGRDIGISFTGPFTPHHGRG